MNKNVNTAANAKKKKKKASGPRFNVFDFLIIVTILVCIGAIVVRAIFIGSAKEEITTAHMVFEVSGISLVTADALCIAEQPIYLQSDDTWIGTVISASASAQKVWEKDETGMLQSAFHPEKKTVRAEALISGTWSEDGFLIGGTNLASVGKTFAIYTPHVSCTVTVVSVSENQ
ncbi:MAG: DUF4330 family protein [Ruminococcaceae bacterium]|nr:DUF4330 family protein [Oscillospiraceae bacterium]